MKTTRFLVLVSVVALSAWLSRAWLGNDPLRPLAVVEAQAPSATDRVMPSHEGQSTTLMPDGRILLVGGLEAGSVAQIWDPVTRTAVPVGGGMHVPRAWHSATLMPDGGVLIVGGMDGDGAVVAAPERFDPATETFERREVAIQPRAHHSATLLPDERLLIVGGRDANGGVPRFAELWDGHRSVVPVPSLAVSRMDHQATLDATGRIRLEGGRTVAGTAVTDRLLIDPRTGVVTSGSQTPDTSVSTVLSTMPSEGATDVPFTLRIMVQLSRPADVRSLTSSSVQLNGPTGATTISVIPAEGGRLVFVTPFRALEAGVSYALSFDGAVDLQGQPVSVPVLHFTTVPGASTASAAEDEVWVPTRADFERPEHELIQRPDSPWQRLPPLQAQPGVTAVSGQVLRLNGAPLANVTLEIDEQNVRTDATGRFLLPLPGASGGRHVLEIDGQTANRPRAKYGFFEYGLTVEAGTTNVLPFTIWMPVLDVAHEVAIPSPTTSEVVITTPYIPGLELHLPPGTTITDEEGAIVRRISITPIPVERPPFPLARNVDVPVYFTVQPGGAYVSTSGPSQGAWLVYPNYRSMPPGSKTQFFHYDPDEKDWYVYGLGTVTPNGRQVVPDPRTRIYEFTGAMINGADQPPADGATAGGSTFGDPVDPSTGIFVMRKTDLYLPDVMPIALTRVYNSADTLTRGFGLGMTNPYAMFLWSAQQYSEADLILPDGGRIHYERVSPGTGFADAVFKHTASPTAFYGSVITHNNDGAMLGWTLHMKDGSQYYFGENAPLQSIRDRYGNTITIDHSSGQTGRVTRVTSPHGRWMEFTYTADPSIYKVTQVKDNLGRTLTYTYSAGRLATATDPEGNVTTYTYDAGNRMATIRDGRNTVYLSNQYTNGRVTTQTLAHSGATYQFAYTVDGSGNVTQTDVTNPRGYVTRLAFNANRRLTSQIEAYGTSLQRTFTIERQTGTNFVTARVDGLSRRTEYTYDSATGRVLTETELAGTADAVTTTYTYEPVFNQVATVTDPLSHTWTLSYDSSGKLTGITDPLSHQTTVTLNAKGQLTGVTDPLSHAWQWAYAGGDLVSITDPLNQTTNRFFDAGGRVVRTVDPLGRTTTRTFDKLNRITAFVDARGGQTTLAYDANSNLLSLTDALSHATSFTYDTSDRTASRTDPLTHADSFSYDGNDNLTQVTDRKSQVTGCQYDGLDRVSQVTFQDSSTIAYTWDAGGRLTQLVDSTNGTIARQYDLRDRLTSETTPEGTVSYTYDAAGRRATMTVAGQTAVSYAYDAANRLTSITQGSAVVAITYDNANRRSTLTYPNGIVATYGYDAANQLSSLTYTLGAATVGMLTYTYDSAGNRTAVGGTWARTGIPAAITSATYDAANRTLSWSGATFGYDLNGNLVSDGTNSFTWNARNQLTAISGGSSASFSYDALGRRRGKTVGGTTTNFVYDGLNSLQELSGGGSPTANLMTGLRIDETITRAIASGTSTLLVDSLGSTLALADGSGAIQTTYTYEPFGKETVSGIASTNPNQFSGRENDGTGLYYYRARYYSPMFHRFVSEDPIGFSGGSNLSAYVADRPTMAVDPTGLKPSTGFGFAGNQGSGSGPGAGFGSGGGGAGAGSGADNGGSDNSRDDNSDDSRCKSFAQRWRDSFVMTNTVLPGLFAPSGLGFGLGAGTAARVTFDIPVPSPTTIFNTTATATTLEAIGASAAGAATTAAGYEAGVAIGSAIDAGLLNRCR